MREDMNNRKKQAMKNPQVGFKVEIVGLPESMLQDDSSTK